MSELINNTARNRRLLKEIIKQLHSGVSPEDVRPQLKSLIGRTNTEEIAAMEQELIAEGMPVEEIMGMCDLHHQVLQEITERPSPTPLPSGHPAETFRRENAALASRISETRALVGRLQESPDDAGIGPILDHLRNALADLKLVERHYQRKEQLLFSMLERHDVTGPSKVMWGKDDEVRGLLKAVEEALSEQDATAGEWKIVAHEVITPALNALEEMIAKEENILLPLSQDTLTEQDWDEMWHQSAEYGWTLIEPGAEYAPSPPAQPVNPVEIPRSGDIVFPTGSLNMDQMLSLFRHLPVDLTLVDAEDRVRFFSEGPSRVFQRSPAIIGRSVQNCHPPKSVHIVEQILEDFRSGRQDVAEFWIEMGGRFVHIRYFALHDEQGVYLGTLEVTQDVTGIRKLEGERRLLQYEGG